MLAHVACRLGCDLSFESWQPPMVPAQGGCEGGGRREPATDPSAEPSRLLFASRQSRNDRRECFGEMVRHSYECRVRPLRLPLSGQLMCLDS